MKYSESKAFSPEEILAIEASNNIEQIEGMLIGIAFNEQDLNFAFGVCEKYVNSSSEQLICTSLESLAHLARRFKYLPYAETKLIIENCLKKLPSDEIEWGLELLKEDLKVFTPDLYYSLFQ